MQVCQNSKLATAPTIYKMTNEIIEQYLDNPVTQAVVMQGLEPFDSLDEMHYFIQKFREVSDDDIVIYTGYTEEEIYPYLSFLKTYKNIIIKFGRFIPNQESHFDKILGVRLASPNQYAVKIS